MFYYYVYYMVGMSIFSFLLFWADKRLAEAGKWRIPEIILLASGLFGGCIGSFFAMRLLSHKIRYARFAMGIPLMILAHGCLLIYILEKGHLPIPW